MSSKPVRERRTFEEVTSKVRELLVSGALKPGDRLPAERELSRRLNVSRAALREALRTLEHAGILELKKGKTGGAFVATGNARAVSDNMMDLLHLGYISIADLTGARIWIETPVVRAACARATEADIVALEENVRQAEILFEKGMLLEKSDMNVEFHNLLAQATKNPVMVIIIQSITNVLRHIARNVGSETSRETFRARRRFLKAFRARDADAAVAEMERHLRKTQRLYTRLARKAQEHAGTPGKRLTSATKIFKLVPPALDRQISA